ncbi:hypothetical protein OS493_008894, partial [Desmophyllum pertusum]
VVKMFAEALSETGKIDATSLFHYQKSSHRKNNALKQNSTDDKLVKNSTNHWK